MCNFDLFTYLLAKNSGGGGGGGSTPTLNYKSLTINNDNSITVIDTDNNSHTITPTYTDEVITAITYDNKTVNLEYDNNGNLTKIGDSTIDIDEYSGEAEAVLATLLTLVTTNTQTLDGALTQLNSDRDALAQNLITQGVTVSTTDTITNLVPKILDISGGGGGGELTLPLENINVAPIEITYPSPTLAKLAGVLSLTEGQELELAVTKDGEEYTYVETVFDLYEQSEGFGHRLGITMLEDDMLVAIINDCDSIDFSEATVSGSGSVIIYAYSNDSNYFTIRTIDNYNA